MKLDLATLKCIFLRKTNYKVSRLKFVANNNPKSWIFLSCKSEEEDITTTTIFFFLTNAFLMRDKKISVVSLRPANGQIKKSKNLNAILENLSSFFFVFFIILKGWNVG